MAHTKPTFCRICEPSCPIVTEFDDGGRITALRPDLGHQSGGVACHKGLSFLEVHRDPDRLNWPQKRLNPRAEPRGQFVETGWDDAMANIGARISQLREVHGPNAVAVYFGNPLAFNAAALMFVGEFQDTLQTQMRFGANTQDAASKLLALGAVYGTSEAMMSPDLQNTEYLLCIGTNPKVSRWTTISVPNNWDVVKDIPKRGGKVRFVNPRKTESSTQETGPTILIRPGTDVYFLAAVLNEIERCEGFNEAIIKKYGKNVDQLIAFVREYPAERIAVVTGIAVEVIQEVAADLVAAKSAAVFVATGIAQSRQGVLCAWLVEILNFVTGNLGRKGGMYKPAGLIEDFSPVAGYQHITTSIARLELPDPIGYALLPGVLLPDLIEAGDVKALIVLAGNPLLTMGGGEKARRAYEKLELLVSLDIYRNATGELSDYVLPATDWLERPDFNLPACSGAQPAPYVQYTQAMVEPAGGRRNEWWILARLLQAAGLKSPLDDFPDETSASYLMNAVLGARGLSIDQLMAQPSHTSTFPQASYDSVFDRCLKHKDGKIDCFPELFVTSGLIGRCSGIFDELTSRGPHGLCLISLRTPYLHNSWLGNSRIFRRGKNAENPLHMTEHDAAAHGLFAGDAVRVSSESGSIETRILIDDDLCPGAVAISHGYGHERSFALSVAQKNPGSNCNSLMPIGIGSYEPVSYMSWLSGVPVSVKRVNSELMAEVVDRISQSKCDKAV